jgi:hypothetical protein
LLILQGYIFRTLQHFATKLCNFTNFRMLFCLLSHNDIFRLCCLDKKLVDSCRNCLLLEFMAIINNFSTLRRISSHSSPPASVNIPQQNKNDQKTTNILTHLVFHFVFVRRWIVPGYPEPSSQWNCAKSTIHLPSIC